MSTSTYWLEMALRNWYMKRNLGFAFCVMMHYRLCVVSKSPGLTGWTVTKYVYSCYQLSFICLLASNYFLLFNDTVNYVEWNWQGKNRDNPVPVPLCPLKIPTRTGLGFYPDLHIDRPLSDLLHIDYLTWIMTVLKSFPYCILHPICHNMCVHSLLFIQVSAIFSKNEVTSPLPPSPKRPKSGLRVLSLFDGTSTGKNSSPQHQLICYILYIQKRKSTCHVSLTACSLSYIWVQRNFNSGKIWYEVACNCC